MRNGTRNRVILAGLCLAAACGGGTSQMGMGGPVAEQPGVNPDTLRTHEWFWLGTVTNVGVFATQTPESYTLSFGDSARLAVRADCNRGTTTYRLDGPALEFRAIALTRMACGRESQGDQFARDLQSVRRAKMQSGVLFLDQAGPEGNRMYLTGAADARLKGYDCFNGGMVLAVVKPGGALVWWAGRHFQLAETRTPTGSQFRDGGVVLYDQDERVGLEIDGQLVGSRCRRLGRPGSSG